VDGQVYAVAQGPVVTGGFVSGKTGNSQTVNHPTVGRVPGGAIVERAGPSLPPGGKLKLQLRQPDFTTAVRVSEIVNKRFSGGAPVAQAENSALISVNVPAEYARGLPNSLPTSKPWKSTRPPGQGHRQRAHWTPS
jgi:flagellar P-ring protein precursor FlgI